MNWYNKIFSNLSHKLKDKNDEKADKKEEEKLDEDFEQGKEKSDDIPNEDSEKPKDKEEDKTSEDQGINDSKETDNNIPNSGKVIDAARDKFADLFNKMSTEIDEAVSKKEVDPNIAMMLRTFSLLASQTHSSQVENNKIQNELLMKTTSLSDSSSTSTPWNKLDDSIKSTILTAMSDGIRVYDKPTDGFIKLLQAKNGANVKMRLHQIFPHLIMDIDVGMCTAISRGLLLSLPDCWAINNFSPFLLLQKVNTSYHHKVFYVLISRQWWEMELMTKK